jgi:hypothetical protein
LLNSRSSRWYSLAINWRELRGLSLAVANINHIDRFTDWRFGQQVRHLVFRSDRVPVEAFDNITTYQASLISR